MNTVASLKTGVKASVSDACHWIEQKGKSGELKPKTAQLWVTAINALVSVLREDESKDAEYVLQHVDELARRWGNLHPENRGDTIRAYESRSRSGLTKFASWRADPSSVKFTSREAKDRPTRPKVRSNIAVDVTPENASPAPTSMRARTFPLGEGREVDFALPLDFDSRDVRRFACHLLTLASDFDPTEPLQAQFFAIARHRDTV